jgi:hypothetical protein
VIQRQVAGGERVALRDHLEARDGRPALDHGLDDAAQSRFGRSAFDLDE